MMNILSWFYYSFVEKRNEEEYVTPNFDISSTSRIPSCPVSISEDKWDAAFKRLDEEITINLWSEAVACGFSKTELGRITGWCWHVALMEKTMPEGVSEMVCRSAARALEFIWHPSSDPDAVREVEDASGWGFIDPDVLYDVLSLYENHPENTLAYFIRFLYTPGDALELMKENSRRLANKISLNLPFIFDNELMEDEKYTHRLNIFREKILGFRYQLNEKVSPGVLCISSPIIRQIEVDLNTHIKSFNQSHPDKEIEDALKEWDEIKAAYSIHENMPDENILSVFINFNKILYGEGSEDQHIG
ncbi:hypothetical protein SC171_21525 [Pantoea cypripedii]|uniref:hypothetical protein n=1 Tax=Pantoea cypripedii TaxID=55209 RepID=UPI002FCA5ABB